MLIGLHLAIDELQILEATNGADALAACRGAKVDLVLLDLDMPGMGGLAVLTSLKADPALAAIPVVLVTGRGESPEIIEGLTLGAHDYVPKPFKPAELRARVNAALRVKHAQDALANQAEALRFAEERFRSSFEHAPIGMAIASPEGQIIEANAVMSAMLGYSKAELATMRWRHLSHPDDATVSENAAARLRDGEINSFQIEKRFLHADGRTVWCLLSVAAVVDSSGMAKVMVAQIEDITDRKDAERRLAHQALHDPLTGLCNRLLLTDRIRSALARSDRLEGSVAVLFIDLDRFKAVNDTYGHDVGDQVLCAVAERVGSAVRPDDTVARIGGDEFVVIAERLIDGEADAILIGERIEQALAPPIVVSEGEVFVTASIGISLTGTGLHTPEALLRDSDTAMYRAKERGRDRLEVFDDTLRNRAMARLATEHLLRHALSEDAISVHYQPIIDLANGELAGFEALMRIRDADARVLSPEQFLGIAEDSGLIVPLGARVLALAFEQHRAWASRSRLPLRLAVNLSACELSRHNLLPMISDALAGSDESLVTIEITESALIEASPSVHKTLFRLKDRGVRLSIDDFGTGYASLTYLKRFPIDEIKLDRSFVAGMLDNREDAAIVKAVLGLGAALGLHTVAEGVEKVEQRTALAALGCAYVQGYLFSPPVAADEAENMLQRPMW